MAADKEVWFVKDQIQPNEIAPPVTPESGSGDPRKKRGFRSILVKYATQLKEKAAHWRDGQVHMCQPRRPVVCDLHASLHGALLLCQFSGLFPVSGLMGMDREALRFSWCSFQFVYFLVSLTGQFVMAAMCLYRLTSQGFNLVSITNLLFYGSALVSSALFFRLALGWPWLMRAVAELERPLPGSGRRVVRACNFIALTVLVLAAVEHILSVVFRLCVTVTCSPSKPVLRAYFKYAAPWIFDYFQFDLFKGFLTEVFNLQSTFMWNFTDVFIMVLSLHLTAHFQRLNRTLDRISGKVDASWGDLRLRYCRLSRLVWLVDSRVSGLILVSFTSNLFFVCLQLFNSLSKANLGYFTTCSQKVDVDMTLLSLQHSIYFVYSFTFLTLRALLVSLLAANVHSAARAPARALYDVPTPAFSIDAQRFLDQVHFSTVALSGLKFFYVTRSMILTVVGTIVTYELVLLQFSPGGGSEDAMDAGNATNETHL